MSKTAVERLLREHKKHPTWTALDWAEHLGVTRVRIHQIKWEHGLKIPDAVRIGDVALGRAYRELQQLGLTRTAAPELFKKILRRHRRRYAREQRNGAR